MFKILSVTVALFFVMIRIAAAMTPDPASAVIPVAAVYPAQKGPHRIALFLSGDGGWNLGVVSMAQAVSAQGYTVLGIDFPHYIHTRDNAVPSCIPLSDDLAATSKAFTSHESSTDAGAPLLIGYSSGATAVYGALAEAAADVFMGGISLGFGPDLLTQHPLCRGAGLTASPDPKLGFIYAPKATLGAPWVALQGDIDQVVSPQVTQDFTNQIKNGQVVMLPHVGHGFSVERNWMPQFQSAVTRLATAR